MKNKIFIIILSIFLLLPISTWAVEDVDVINQDVNTKDKVETIVEENNTQYKQPISKRKIAKKFLLAMSGVAISSIILFILLSLYNKLREGFVAKTGGSDIESDLETPQDINSAVKSFLNKTSWKD